MADLRKLFSEHKITRVKLGGFDVDGVLRGKYMSLEKFWSAVDKGFGFCDVVFGWDVGDTAYDNARVTGSHTGYPDVHAVIDPSTFRVIPWEPDTATFLVDFHTADGSAPHAACPRGLLRSVIAHGERLGYRANFAAEFEFFVFKESPESVREKSYRGMTPISPGMFGYSWLREGQHSTFLRDVLETMERYDIEVECLHTETGPGVYEAAIRYDDALRAADKAALFKTTLKQVAHRHGLMATFMAKWSASLPGSSGHLHQSLWDTRFHTNQFLDARHPSGLSDKLRQYVAGQCALMPELTALYAPTVNSYKRYVPGVWAPVTATWGVENRTCAVRIVGAGTSAARVEYRQPGADMNPYLAIAASYGAGLYGVEHGLVPPAVTEGDGSTMLPGRTPLPRTLADATARLAASTAAKEILGEGFVDHYVRTREWEVRQYDRAVTDWELARYFEVI